MENDMPTTTKNPTQTDGWIRPEDVDAWDDAYDVTEHVILAVEEARWAVREYYADMIGQRPARREFEERVARALGGLVQDDLDRDYEGRHEGLIATPISQVALR